MNVLSGATLFCKITHAPNIFKIRVDTNSLGRFVLIFSFNTNLGAHMAHLRFGVLFGRNNCWISPMVTICSTFSSFKYIQGESGLPESALDRQVFKN